VSYELSFGVLNSLATELPQRTCRSAGASVMRQFHDEVNSHE
jgi:hypothetical protein